MGAYTSLQISRKKAKEALVAHLLGPIDDKTLEAFLDQVLEPGLYNAVIVGDDSTEDDQILDQYLRE